MFIFVESLISLFVLYLFNSLQYYINKCKCLFVVFFFAWLIHCKINCNTITNTINWRRSNTVFENNSFFLNRYCINSRRKNNYLSIYFVYELSESIKLTTLIGVDNGNDDGDILTTLSFSSWVVRQDPFGVSAVGTGILHKNPVIIEAIEWEINNQTDKKQTHACTNRNKHEAMLCAHAIK